MRKYITIFLFAFLSIFITGCQSDIITLTVDLPYVIHFDMGAAGGELDFKVPIRDVRVISNLNSNLHTSFNKTVNKTVLNYWYGGDQSDMKLIPYEVSTYPLVLHQSTIEVDIKKRDLNKFHTEFINGVVDILNTQNNSNDFIFYDSATKHLNFNYAATSIQDIYTGNVARLDFPVYGDIKGLFAEIIVPTVKEFEAQWHNDYIKSHPEFIEFVKTLTEGLSTNEEKINSIVSWASTIESYTPEGDTTDPSYNQQFGVNHTIKYRRGNCTNIAYLIKSCLDLCNIENRLVYGYIPLVNKYHVINTIKGDKGFNTNPEFLELLQSQNQHININDAAMVNKKWIDSDWIWIDGGLNQINDIGLYFCFEAFQDLDLDYIK